MDSIVKEKLVSFKELEQKVFKYVCGLGREITQIMLETYDEELAASRDSGIPCRYAAFLLVRRKCLSILPRAHEKKAHKPDKIVAYILWFGQIAQKFKK